MTLVLHLGAPKTATSTLQHAFFPRHPGVLFLGKEVDGRRGWKGWRTTELEVLMLALERTNLDFCPDRTAVARIVEEVAADAVGRPIVISSEDLCLFSSIDSLRKLERIRELFGALGELRLILAVRDQVSLLKSIYLTEHRGEMLHLTGTQQDWYPSFDRYLDIHFRYACGAVLESFRFAAMIERYEALVGRDNVFVYAFNDFKRDALATLRALCRFIGIDDAHPCLEQAAETRENQQFSSRLYGAPRLRNYMAGQLRVGRLLPGSVRRRVRQWLDGGRGFDFAASPQAIRRITDYYASDNEMLYAKRGIRLARADSQR
jgi:hypothetical protein